MQLEDYFDFETVETKFGPVEKIRIKGHRIGIEYVLEYFRQGFSPETILRDVYPSLNLEKIYATILYYLANHEKVEAYVRRADEIGEKFVEEQRQKGPSDLQKRIVAAKAEQQTAHAG